MEGHFELLDKSGKTQQADVQDVKIRYQVDEQMKCLLDEKAFGCTAKYHAHLKHIEDLH